MQFCVDPVDNGALSSCPAGEGHTWGKVSAECVEFASVYVHCDVTAVFPWLTHALLNSEARDQLDGTRRVRPHKRLYDRLPEAMQKIDADVAEVRDRLMEGIHERPEELG